MTSHYINGIIGRVLGTIAPGGRDRDRAIRLEAELQVILHEQIGDLDALKNYTERDRKEMALWFIEQRTKQLESRLKVE